MGGYGSGRKVSKKSTVEDGRTLDLKSFTDYHPFAANSWFSGRVTWRQGDTETASLGYTVELGAEGGWVRLFYTIRGDTSVDYRVRLSSTPLHYGGGRWWFHCPASGCGRRVRKLHLAPGGTHYACRQCYHLTYESSQTHDARVAFFLTHPEAVAAALNSREPARFLLAAKAVLGRGIA
jgi:hypothetical protein